MLHALDRVQPQIQARSAGTRVAPAVRPGLMEPESRAPKVRHCQLPELSNFVSPGKAGGLPKSKLFREFWILYVRPIFVAY